MACGESNGHTIDDVMWPWRSRSWPRYVWAQRPISQIGLEVQTRLQWIAYRKLHLGYQLVTCPMASLDPTAGAPGYLRPDGGWVWPLFLLNLYVFPKMSLIKIVLRMSWLESGSSDRKSNSCSWSIGFNNTLYCSAQNDKQMYYRPIL